MPGPRVRAAVLVRALVLGLAFGIVLVKSEVVSWFRIQEMFRFQSFHMYGIIGSAILVGMLSLALIRRFGIRDVEGREVRVSPKEWRGRNTRYWLGGTLFGLGWALTGACPGPIYALIGTGATVFLAVLFSALLGTWVYAALRPRLPHF
ncbi:MAG: DUF6691 family protein [Gemmatimonadota bacterium]